MTAAHIVGPILHNIDFSNHLPLPPNTISAPPSVSTQAWRERRQSRPPKCTQIDIFTSYRLGTTAGGDKHPAVAVNHQGKPRISPRGFQPPMETLQLLRTELLRIKTNNISTNNNSLCSTDRCIRSMFDEARRAPCTILEPHPLPRKPHAAGKLSKAATEALIVGPAVVGHAEPLHAFTTYNL